MKKTKSDLRAGSRDPNRVNHRKSAQIRPAMTREQKPNWPETHKPSPTPTRTAQPTYTFPSAQAGPSPTTRPKILRASRQPMPRPETAAHASPSGCATRHICSTTPLGFGGLSALRRLLALAAYSARETYFRPVWHHSDPPGLRFDPV